MPSFLSRIISSYTFLLLSFSLQAESIVSLDKFESPINVASYAIYIDTILNFEQIMQLPDETFSKIEKSDFGKGFLSVKEFWIKLPISYSGNVDIKRVLTSSFSKIDTVTYYLTRGDSIFQKKKGGNSISHLNNDYNYSYPLFELSLPPKFTGILYIQLKPKSFVFFPMEFWEPKSLAFKSLNKQFEEGIIIGILSLFFLSVLVFAFIFKEEYFWFYAMYLFSLILFLSIYHGNLWYRLGIETAGLHNLMADQIVGICFVLFNKSFFETKEKYPLANKLFNLFIALQVTSFLFQAFLDHLSPTLLRLKTIVDLFSITGNFTFNIYILGIAYISYSEKRLTRYLWIFLA